MTMFGQRNSSFFTMTIMFILFTMCITYTFSSPSDGHDQPLDPNPHQTPSTTPNTVPALPVQTQALSCHLDLSAELFGGVAQACTTLDRTKCCPVLAAWLFAAHATSALTLPPPSSPSSPLSAEHDMLPMIPDDSQKCVDSLQTSLVKRNIHIPQPNASCDPILCFCGIRLHQISSLSCPAAFNMTNGFRNVTPTTAVKNLEKNCRNSTYGGCTKCLGALQKLKAGKNVTEKGTSDRVKKMFSRDCQLMGLTWLLARNKTAYIPTVSAVLRAIMYSAHPPHNGATCSPDQENMPLAVDSLQIEKISANSKSESAALAFGMDTRRGLVTFWALVVVLGWHV